MNATRRNLSSLKPYALVLAGVAAGSLFSGMLRPGEVLAQNRSGNSDDKTLPPETVLNAADQRKQIIAPLVQINDRLTRIETMLNAGIKVKVTEMPPVVVKESGK